MAGAETSEERMDMATWPVRAFEGQEFFYLVELSRILHAIVEVPRFVSLQQGSGFTAAATAACRVGQGLVERTLSPGMFGKNLFLRGLRNAGCPGL